MSALKFFADHAVDLLAVLGALSLAGGIVARLTPNKTDDAVMAKVQMLLDRASAMFLHPRP